MLRLLDPITLQLIEPDRRGSNNSISFSILKALALQSLVKILNTCSMYDTFERLTETERKGLHEIARSRTNKEIADQLFLSVRTVETYRYNICAKLDLKRSHSLFKFAVKNRSAIDLAIKFGSST